MRFLKIVLKNNFDVGLKILAEVKKSEGIKVRGQSELRKSLNLTNYRYYKVVGLLLKVGILERKMFIMPTFEGQRKYRTILRFSPDHFLKELRKIHSAYIHYVEG